MSSAPTFAGKLCNAAADMISRGASSADKIISIVRRSSLAPTSHILHDGPAAKVFLADQPLALGAVLQVAAVWHGNRERQSSAAAGTRFGMESHRQFRLTASARRLRRPYRDWKARQSVDRVPMPKQRTQRTIHSTVSSCSEGLKQVNRKLRRDQ